MDTGSLTAGDSSATMAEIFDAQSKNNNGIFRVSMCGGTQELEQISRDGSQYSLTTAILPSLGARSNRRVKLRNFIISPYDRRYRETNVSNWTKIVAKLEAKGSNSNARLQLKTNKKGVIWLDQVSLMPTDTYKGHGFRNDLFKMVADLIRKGNTGRAHTERSGFEGPWTSHFDLSKTKWINFTLTS